MRHALLIGATGLVGRHVLDLLVADPRWDRVTVLARRLIPTERPRLSWWQVDFADPTTWQPHVTATAVFNCMGTTLKQAGSREAFLDADLRIPLAICRAAREHGATHAAVVSSLGADPHSRMFYPRVKGELEASVAAIGFASVHILRPSLLLGERPRTRPGEKVGEVALALARPLLVGGLRKYRGIQAVDVAKAMVGLALDPAPGVRVVLSDELARMAAGHAPPPA